MQMSIVALFTIAGKWKRSQMPFTWEVDRQTMAHLCSEIVLGNKKASL